MTPNETGWTPLLGGTVNTVSRRGAVVRRQRTAASPAIRELLEHLERCGVPFVPRPKGHDAQHDYLSFLPGEAVFRPWPDTVCNDLWLSDLGTWLRTYHDAVRGFRVQGAFLWGPTEPGEGMLVTHGDLGPWNLLQESGRLSGVIDWDLARYGTPLDDVAEGALEAVPLHGRLEETLGTASKALRRARLEVFCRAYGVPVATVIEHVPRYLQRVIDDVRTLAKQAKKPFTAFQRGGIVAGLEADLHEYHRTWSNHQREA